MTIENNWAALLHVIRHKNMSVCAGIRLVKRLGKRKLKLLKKLQ